MPPIMHKIDKKSLEVCHCKVSGVMSMAHLHQPEEIQVILLEESMEGGKVVLLDGVRKIVTLNLIGTQVWLKFLNFCSNLDISADILTYESFFSSWVLQVLLIIYTIFLS